MGGIEGDDGFEVDVDVEFEFDVIALALIDIGIVMMIDMIDMTCGRFTSHVYFFPAIPFFFFFFFFFGRRCR